ncbi:unnamed protein product [Umbelopsis ramanniana]|uniref:Cardiolipin synthase N-terminal domain-containing protein n=1 Tax=Umbelopsis ramanniana AG TaxID=1314678 RepID=A0AAD5EJD7_UMBRA|nr:uncharacterized protein K450DRAFT_220954 [Umbelopsis ramanniana AG]KAI8583991.1 hypothetical protein K450DRAFT_220954 [Umbelopsis ramanniana AG]KAI9284164.1 hypothetical protein BC943DRAFT_361508 [Umbelopsis sp. AD052]
MVVDNMLTISGGFFSLVLLILDFIAIFEILNSTRTTVNKVLWSLFVFFFPVLGLLCYFIFGDRERHNQSYQALP